MSDSWCHWHTGVWRPFTFNLAWLPDLLSASHWLFRHRLSTKLRLCSNIKHLRWGKTSLKRVQIKAACNSFLSTLDFIQNLGNLSVTSTEVNQCRAVLCSARNGNNSDAFCGEGSEIHWAVCHSAGRCEPRLVSIYLFCVSLLSTAGTKQRWHWYQ